jgi:hypothetical protein
VSSIAFAFRLRLGDRGRGTTKMRILGIVALGAALGGCASSSADITPAYVSPVMYQAYTCPQLAQEAGGVDTRGVAVGRSRSEAHQ